MNVFQTIQKFVRLFAIAAAFVAVGPAAYAQQPTPSSIAVAKQLIAASGATAVFTPLIPGVVEQAKLLYLQQNPALGKDLNDIATQMRANLQPRFEEITDEVAKIYATNFTEQELKDILAFYQTPAGKKLLAQQAKVIETSMSFAQNWANKLSDEVIAKMREELQKKGHQL